MPNFYQGKRVVVHCKGGISRAGIFACIVVWLVSDLICLEQFQWLEKCVIPRYKSQTRAVFLLDYETNWQTWIQNGTMADEWLEEMA